MLFATRVAYGMKLSWGIYFSMAYSKQIVYICGSRNPLKINHFICAQWYVTGSGFAKQWLHVVGAACSKCVTQNGHTHSHLANLLESIVFTF